MKKVCLITYSGSPNYGAALQLLATYQVFQDMGCDVSVVNYQNQFESQKTGLRFLLSNVSIKEKLREFISSYIFGVKKNSKNNFSDFYNRMKYTSKITSIDEMELIGDFDIYCVGSDQVWNPYITNGFDDVFILNSNVPRKKISYASSMGSCTASEFSENKFIQSLKNFDYISVREEVAVKYLEKRINKSVKKVVDPTFLLGADGWDKFAECSSSNFAINEKYVLIYALGGDFESNKKVASKIAQMLGVKLYAITLSNRNKGIDRVISNATPFDFVQYIKNASFVVTNSFHGTCFSLMMKVPFYSVRFGANPVRTEELLSLCKLENRLFKTGDVIDEKMLKNDDILKSKNELDLLVADSLEWLRRAVYE